LFAVGLHTCTAVARSLCVSRLSCIFTRHAQSPLLFLNNDYLQSTGWAKKNLDYTILVKAIDKLQNTGYVYCLNNFNICY